MQNMKRYDSPTHARQAVTKLLRSSGLTDQEAVMFRAGASLLGSLSECASPWWRDRSIMILNSSASTLRTLLEAAGREESVLDPFERTNPAENYNQKKTNPIETKTTNEEIKRL